MHFLDFGTTGPCPCEMGRIIETEHQTHSIGAANTRTEFVSVSIEVCRCGRHWLMIAPEEDARRYWCAVGLIAPRAASNVDASNAISALTKLERYAVRGVLPEELVHWTCGELAPALVRS